MRSIVWELRQSGVLFVLFWQLVVLPYRLYKVTVNVLGRVDRLNFHEYVSSVCGWLQVSQVARRIEALRFLDVECHEAEVSRFLSKLRGGLFVDVGANLGRYSILLASHFNRVVAVEPEPTNMAVLKGNLEAVGVENVKTVQYAVSNLDGSTVLFFGIHSGGHSILGTSTRRIPVPCVRLDTLLDGSPADLVKVDVEGAEFQVLEGVGDAEIKRWMVELHDPKAKKKIEGWFLSRSYRVRWLDWNGVTENHIYAWRN